MKRNTKLMGLMLSAAMIFTSFAGTYATEAVSVENAPIQVAAQLYGKHDLKSTELTSVMVEIKEESIVAAKHNGKVQTKGNLKESRGKVVSAIAKNVKDAKVEREYDYLFSGFALELPANEIPKLLMIEGVKAVYPDVEYKAAVVEESTLDADAFSPNMLNSAPFIESQKAWDAGYTGEGMKVAVIDTGVDYNHPDLKHAFGDYKGWDMVDNDNDPMETLPGDPRGEATDHGSHVAGTIAANGLIKGVAPDATLYAYRVLGPGGSGSSAGVIAGIEKAVQDGVDVMNLSLGNSLNDPDYATSLTLDWAMAEGVVAVTSNGNSGPDNWTVGSPGTSRRAISVGATKLPYNVYNGGIFTSEGVNYNSQVMGFASDAEILALNGKEFEFVYVGLGGVNDFVGKDVTGKIALISRGAYPFFDKATNAKAAGAAGAIIFNHLPGQIPFEVDGMAVPTLRLSNEDGKKMLAELAAGNNKVKFDISLNHRVGETVADFSSRGPVMNTWMIKPDVSAPGVAINSTIRDGKYGSKQGTSMASPHVAGAAALVLQANPHWGVDEVKAALMNTAVDMIDPATGKPYPHNAQGAGSIRVLEAINAKTLALPGSHSFGVFYKGEGKEVRTQSFDLMNLSNVAKNYTFQVEFKGNPAGIKVMTSSNLRVNAGSKQKVGLNVQVDAASLPAGYYEGTIKISDGTQVIDLPTILFVQEPDYPRVSAFYFEPVEGGYDITAHLPGGAEVLEYWMYEYNGGVGNYVGDLGAWTDLSAGYHSIIWDGTMNGNPVPPGQYAIFVYVEANGVTDLQGHLVEVK